MKSLWIGCFAGGACTEADGATRVIGFVGGGDADASTSFKNLFRHMTG